MNGASCAVAMAALVAMAGCAKRSAQRMAYHYRGPIGGAMETLRPPVPAPLDSTGHVNLRIKIGKAKAKPAECVAELPSIHFHRDRTRALVKVNLEGASDPSRIPVELLDSFQQLHMRLSGFEQIGCLKKGEADAVFLRVLEYLEMPSQTLYYLRYGSFPQTGYFDLDARFRLQVISPVKDGTFSGFETISYFVRPAKAGPGFQLIPTSYVAGPLRFPEEPAFYRLFFLSRSSASDRDITILAAPSRELMELATVQHLASTVGCPSGLPTGVQCIAAPPHVAVAPELAVLAQGATVYVPLGGRVADALRSAGEREPAKVVSELHILRPYQGKLVPVQFDTDDWGILSMLLIGGEVLTW